MASILDFEKPEPPYMILETFPKNYGQKKYSKLIYAIKLNKSEQEIKMGRGAESQIRIPDISVSRFHSSLLYKPSKQHL